MNSPTETAVVIVIVLLAGAYLTRRYLLKQRQSKDSSCGGSCGCSVSKPKIAQK
ncbi:FeoB-associated Cys-rich membrane protein [Pelagicoccus sp. SDUM812002]|uniref:FeoB-associated Cys-rich membrane protein n=1 Tax=Pelagicoccus sp. SDUM812002 TaxID=3041266 RepID=UPI00280EFCFB|nr:FeoB-associated Cys-rich membrane protein [Pelagicoccus sp. SDUM812002]MDQ8187647.1 FeoB-associated Cys-rich membrane protein [Pelagicoccus sp. SDUM812002]